MQQSKIAIIGANGMLANMLREIVPESVELHLFDLPDFNITDYEHVNTVLADLQPFIIINCAACTQVDSCETQSDLAFAVNGEGPANLAAVAKKVSAILVHISTDFIFSGAAKTPYNEDDTTGPTSVYGHSTLHGDQAVLNSGLTDYYIVRTSWLYGPKGPNFVETIIRLMNEREELGIVADQVGTPTYTGDLAAAIWKLISPIISNSPSNRSPYGIYHYSNQGVCSWYDFACEIARQLRDANVLLKVKHIKPIATDEYPVPARRPAYSVLSKEKIIAATGICIPVWQESLKKYLNSRF
jgi:dTDP-4-dehydrorhamnose reductase